jgi:hypothetical protein
MEKKNLGQISRKSFLQLISLAFSPFLWSPTCQRDLPRITHSQTYSVSFFTTNTLIKLLLILAKQTWYTELKRLRARSWLLYTYFKFTQRVNAWHFVAMVTRNCVAMTNVKLTEPFVYVRVYLYAAHIRICSGMSMIQWIAFRRVRSPEECLLILLRLQVWKKEFTSGTVYWIFFQSDNGENLLYMQIHACLSVSRPVPY